MSSKPLTTEEIIKEIEGGKYRDCYPIYGRRSSDDTEHQKNSLKFQRIENTRYAHNAHLPLATLTLDGFCTDGVISERHSAFKEDYEIQFGKDNSVHFRVERPKFYLLAKWLSKGYFKGVVFYCWDRASRNKADEVIIRKLMKMGLDLHFVIAKYDKSSAGELHMDIDGSFAAHHSRVTSEKVSMTIKNSRARGWVTNKAPVGYLNQGTMEYKPLDPVRAPIISKMFEMYATGEWSLADLARWANQQGFTMPPVRRRRTEQETLAEEDDDVRLELEAVCRPATYNGVHKILTNLFYTGRTFDENRQWIFSTSHEAITTDEIFNEVQQKLRKNNKSAHYAELLDHPLRGMMRCEMCRRVYTPYPKKGIMYYGAHCSETCTNPNSHFNIYFITTKIGELITNLSFTDEELEKLNARTGTEIALLETRRLNKLETNERRKKKIREDLAYLNTSRLDLLKTGAYTPEAIVAEYTKLNFELTSLQEEEKVSDVAIQETVKDVIKLSELIKNLYIHYENATPHEKEAIIKELFSELTINGNTLQYQCTRGFQPLAHRFIAPYDPTGSRTRLPSLKSLCPNR